jgi:hypothetical protein
MTSINTLIPDIYQLVGKKDGWFTTDLGRSLGEDIGIRLSSQLGVPDRRNRLRLSQMGPRCPRALWHSIHTPELAEALPPWAEVKFSFGHILEALAISLAKAAGHDVQGEQDEVNVDGIKGHRDCVIDGCVVDVKSCSTRAFQKLKTGTIRTDDGFGYLDQLDGYVVGSLQDPLVTVKDRGYLLGIDKTLGHMVLFEHKIREDSIRQRIATYKQIVKLFDPPPCECGTESFQESGNIKLDVRASYSAQKYCCFPHLRTFIYADKIVYLTKVVRRPAAHIIEIDKNGKVVYN